MTQTPVINAVKTPLSLERNEDQVSTPILPSTTAMAKGLHADFANDVLVKKAVKKEPAARVVAEETQSSRWTHFIAWLKEWRNHTTDRSIQSEQTNQTAGLERAFMSSTPLLDPPAANLKIAASDPLPPLSKSESLTAKLPLYSIEEALALMSSKTIESIMFTVFNSQIQLEKENANVIEKSYSKHMEFQKKQQELLCEIKDILIQDETMAKKFGTAQNIAWGASLLAGIAGIAVTYGLMAPLWGFLSTATAAGMSVLTHGGKAYFEHQMNEHKVLHNNYRHHNDYYSGRSEDFRERLLSTAEADSVFKERWAMLLRRTDKMRKLILKK